MENIIEMMKTPSRTRKSSVDTVDVSTKKRSVIKETIREIEETDNVFNDKDRMTPRRATRTLDFQTPSRSEALIGNQTPRRSVRKSFKPVQEYENIVAQKGLSAKRSAFTLPNEESEVVEAGTKWEPSVIGRASTKRSKKSKRSKKQKKAEKERAEVQENVIISNEDKEDENMIGDENKKTSDLIEQVNDAENNVKTNMDQHEQPTESMNLQTLQIDEHVSDLSDTSIANGDALMSVMPITGDDCIKSPEKTSPLFPKMSNVSVVIESTNKSDDSDDCVMLSFNGTLSPATKCDNVSRDSAELNMPALLVCSDDEDDVEFVDASPSIELVVEKKIENCENTQLNSTFDTGEKDEFVVALSGPNQTERVQEPEESVEERLSLSKVKQIIGDPNRTFDADEVPIVPITVTPIHVKTTHSSVARTVTPYKLKQAVVPDIVIEHEGEIQDQTIPEIFIMETNETKLYRIRKRSNSLCIDRPKKNVRFHSPSNTTVFMSFDMDLGQSVSKNDPHRDITKRRKRSMSVTETEREFLDYIQHKKPARETPQKKQQVSRIKMPNFSAIHLKQFKKMESITDHVARRAERAKVLINSNTKVKPASIQKSLVKNSILRDQNVDKSGTKSLLPKPKARQRIELSGIGPTNDSRLNDLRKTPSKVFEKSRFVFGSTSKANQLPKPMFNFTTNTNTIKQKNIFTFKPTTTAISTIAGTSAGPIQRLPNPKKDFNLSTAITESHINRGADKVDERRNRMMDMFKSRVPVTQRKDKNKEILKGVRTNRRFELQMMCRNRPPN